MATVRVRGDAAELRDARGKLAALAEEWESDGIDPDELWPRLNAIRDDIEEFEVRARRAIRQAA
jgi:hypothetical protein